MERLSLGKWLVAYDYAGTRAVYDLASKGTHSCTCASCRNFVAVRDQAYPSDFLQLLSALGIDPRKEAEIAEFGPVEGGRLYQGWYHFIGEVLNDPGDQLTFVNGSYKWTCFFSSSRALAHREFGDHPLVQLDWSVVLPWRILEPPGC